MSVRDEAHSHLFPLTPTQAGIQFVFRKGGFHTPGVMAGLVPAIHVFDIGNTAKAWMPGIKPGMTMESLYGVRSHTPLHRTKKLPAAKVAGN